jgi:hypothetical protein
VQRAAPCQRQNRPIFDDDNVSICVAPIDALLMKLNAARPGRDTDDIAKLLRLNSIATVEAAEQLFEAFYPADGLPDKAIELLRRIFSVGLPERPTPPAAPNFA